MIYTGNIEAFSPLKERLCLDFVNTSDEHPSKAPAEFLTSYARLVEWSVYFESINDEQAEQLLALARQYPDKENEALGFAIHVRETLFRVLAAAAAGKPRFDGVCNRLDDMDGFDAECRQGSTFGFTGKTLIHPNQISITNEAFGSDPAVIAEAEELIAASRGGAQRFKGRMIETMHVEEAQMTIERSRAATEGV